MISQSWVNEVLTVEVYGREGLENAKDVLGNGTVTGSDTIVVKVHFARPNDLNGGNQMMSCMFAHSLVPTRRHCDKR